MTADQITQAILQGRYQRHFCLPRYTPVGWWECDIFEITKAGFFREYEVKISLSDFKADAGKVRDNDRWARSWGKEPRFKHQEIGQPHGPSQFWYVCPEGLLTPEIVPQWAGLIVLHKSRWGTRLIETELKPAPKLHKQKADPKIRPHAEGVCYWRLLNFLTTTKRHDYEIPTETEETLETDRAPEMGPADQQTAVESQPDLRP